MIEKEERIRTRAYYLSELRKRYQMPSNPVQDWLEAEREVNHDVYFHQKFDL